MRNILIIALVSVAVFLETDERLSKIKCARVALNRLAGKIPQRALNVEKEIIGKELNDQTIGLAVHRLEDELTLTSDFRASAEYRQEAAKILLRRALIECQQGIIEK